MPARTFDLEPAAMRRGIAAIALTAVLLAVAAAAAARVRNAASPPATATINLADARQPASDGAGQGERPDDQARTIAGLQRISVVGSTQFIVDGAGHTASEDANPYGVAVVPASLSPALRAGDLVVTNIGATDTGTTLVKFPARQGPGRLFNVAATPGTLGPANVVVDARQRTVWVSNASGSDLQVLNPDGSTQSTITDPALNHPWGLATNQSDLDEAAGASPTFFASNVADATIVRVVPHRGQSGTTFRVTPVGHLPKAGEKTKIGLAWVPKATVKGQALGDVLLAVDPADNSLVAFPNASREGAATPGVTVFQGKPVNFPNDLTINPLNGDAILTNLNDNNLVEINLAAGKAVATRTVDSAPVDLQTGNGSALIGLAATTDGRGGLVVYFADDNMNTVNALSA